MPGRIAGQLALLVVAAIVVTHVVVTVAFLLLRPELRRSDERPNALANRLVTVVHMVAAAPAEDRTDVVAAARRSASALHLTLLPSNEPNAPRRPAPRCRRSPACGRPWGRATASRPSTCPAAPCTCASPGRPACSSPPTCAPCRCRTRTRR